jgi:hypothetical protein
MAQDVVWILEQDQFIPFRFIPLCLRLCNSVPKVMVMKEKTLAMLVYATTALFSSIPAFAADEQPPVETKSEVMKALTEGELILDARYRYEFVDQNGLARDANAHTVRTRLGYETAMLYDFSVLIEGENILALGGERFNDTINGKTTYPTVADPEDTRLNRLQLRYAGIPDTDLILGRQLINLDNQRFVGAVDWRQNNQTFDAFSIKNQSVPDTTLFYAYADQVNRIFGTDSPFGTWNNSHIHLFNASYAGLSCGKITGYGYLLDIADAKAMSSASFGARFEGKQLFQEGLNGLFNLEYAHQADYASNPNHFSFHYYSVEPGIGFGSWTLKGQYESIEGDGGTTANAMQFALGTNHAFDGWVDKFLTTPANGLVDANIGVSYVAKSEKPYFNGTKVMLVYHDFSAERGNTGYGTEWDVMLEQTFEKHYTAGIKLGRYEAAALFTDTVRIMPYLQVKF